MKVMNGNVWEILGLTPGVSKKEIRRQYAKLSRQCHPEENPEKFAEIQNAYNEALRLCENAENTVVFVQSEKNEETETSLLDKLNQSVENDLELYINSGIIKTIFDTLSDKKRKNKPAVWQEIFLTEEFLSEQFKDNFADGIIYVFEHIPRVEDVNEVPSAFLTELAIAYGISVDDDGQYWFGNGWKIEKVIKDYWFSMPEEWYLVRAAGYLKKKQNRVRAVSFAMYIELMFMHESTFTNESERLKWQEIVWKLRAESFYENNKTDDNSVCCSRIFIDLCTNWLGHHKVPENVVTYIYKQMYLGNLDSVSCGEWYKPLRNCIIRCYPDLECLDNGKNEIKSKFIAAYMTFKAWNDKLEESFHGNGDFDKTAYDEKCKEFFENDVWREHAKDSVIINYLVEIGNFVHLHYDAVDKMFYTYYDADKIYDDTETELLENLIRARNFSKSHYGVVTDKRPLYILKYGFGIRKLAGVKIYEKYDMYGSDGVLNLPKYIDYLFTISTKDFEGYDSEVYEYKFNDGNILRYKFEYKNVRIWWNEVEVYGDVLPTEKFLSYADELSEFRDFTAILSILDRNSYKNDNEDLKKSVRQCIEKWLMPLELTSNIRSRIIDAILMGQDEISSLGEFVICEGNRRKLYIASRKGKFIPYLYTDEELIRLPEYAGAKYAKNLKNAGEIYGFHKTNMLKQYDVKGMDEAEISNIIFEGLMLNAKSSMTVKDSGKHECDKNYSQPFVKEYMEREGKYIENAFVVLEGDAGIHASEVLAVSFLGQGICSPDSCGRFGVVSQELEKEVMKKYSEESVTIGWLTGEHSCFNAQPIVLGESGTLYIKAALSKVVSGKSIKDVMKYYSPISNFEKVKVYSNILAWSRFENNFDYSFEADDYEDKDSLANYFGTCRFK